MMMSFQILPNSAYFYLKEHKILITINKILQGTFIKPFQHIAQKITAAACCISSALKRIVSHIPCMSSIGTGLSWPTMSNEKQQKQHRCCLLQLSFLCSVTRHLYFAEAFILPKCERLFCFYIAEMLNEKNIDLLKKLQLTGKEWS